MVKRMFSCVCAAALLTATAPALAGGCKGCEKVAKSGDGFCCGKGKAFGVDVSSKKLYAALAGQTVSQEDAKKCPCADCKTAAKTNGSCDRCKVTAGKMYKSPVAYSLAKGAPISSELVAACPKRCVDCKSAFKKNGKCKNCDVGFVAGRMFEKDSVYTAALAAFETLVKAASVAGKCEPCAVAMVTDGKCDKCNIKFKGGKLASHSG